MINFIITCLLIMPWVFLPVKDVTNQFRLPQGNFLNFMFFGIIFFYFLNGARNVYRNKYLAWFVGYIFLNIFFFFFVPFSFEKISGANSMRQLNFWMLEPMLHFILGIFATYIALSYLERDDYIKIAKTICVSATLISIFAILQYIGFDPFGKIATYRCGNRVSACLDNPNLVGNYLALSLPFLFSFIKNKKYMLMTIIVLCGIYVAKSHFAQGLAVLGVILFTLLKFRKSKIFKYILFTILTLSILLSFLVIKFDYLKLNSGVSGRLNCWKYAVEQIKVNPLFGQSLGIWKTFEFKTWNTPEQIGSKEGVTVWFNTHNDWLQYLIEIGLVGIFLLILVIVNSVRGFTFEHEFGLSYLVSFIVFLVMMVASFPIEVPSIAILGLIAFWGVEKL